MTHSLSEDRVSCMTIHFSMLATHQLRHQATRKVGCQPGDCKWWTLKSSSGVCVGMYGLICSLCHSRGSILYYLELFASPRCSTQREWCLVLFGRLHRLKQVIRYSCLDVHCFDWPTDILCFYWTDWSCVENLGVEGESHLKSSTSVQHTAELNWICLTTYCLSKTIQCHGIILTLLTACRLSRQT